MRSTLRCAIGASVLALALTACVTPTGHPSCDQHLSQLLVAKAHGFRFDCYPERKGLTGYRPGTNLKIAGWADISTGTAYIWPDHITQGSRSFSKIMWHELGHLRHHQLGGTGRDEGWADAYAWCRAPFPELYYIERPADCSRYLR